MDRLWWVRTYRVVFGLLVLVAIVFQAWYLADHDKLKPGNYVSFMTIESNVLAGLVLLWGASGDQDRRSARLVDGIRGATALYLVMVGIVVAALLSGSQEDLSVPLAWVDAVVHQWVPLVMLADWLIVPPHRRITWKRAAWWLVYPLVYVVYSLIRGPIVDWYPYPFLNPDHTNGYLGVAGYCVGITVAYIVVGWLVLAIGNVLSDQREGRRESMPARG